jgi:hypothetical protein
MRRVAGALVALMFSGCAPASAPPAKVAQRNTAAKAALAPSELPREVVPEVIVSGDAMSLNGAHVERDDLPGALERSRGASELLSVKLASGSSNELLASLIAAAPRAGFKATRLRLGVDQLTVAAADPASKPRLIAWTSGDRLVVYDLEEPEPHRGLLGSFQLADDDAVAELGKQLGLACQGQPCKAELELIPTTTPDALWRGLSCWQKVADGLPTLSFRVSALDVGYPKPTGETPRVRVGATAISGRLPPVVIQRIVRKNFDKFRGCYEAGLGRNADLTGRISARFVIGRDGKVSKVADAGSDIADVDVKSCVLQAFEALEFPPPLNGIVTVVYPILFAPG